MNKHLSLIIVWVLGISLTIYSQSYAVFKQSENLVEQAWQAWEKNDQTEVEAKFKAATAVDPTNSRAYLGLSYLYQLQSKQTAAWEAFSKVLEIEKNPYPYLFSAMMTLKYSQGLEDKAVKLLEKVSLQADSANILKAMANEGLGEYYFKIGKLKEAIKYYQKQNTINKWLIIGPFENIAASGYNKVYPPEEEFVTDTFYVAKNGIPARWIPLHALQHNCWINFLNYLPYTNAVFYANNFIFSPQKQTVEFRIGTSGSFKAFLNEELIHGCADENNNDLDTYIVETELQAGWNRFMIKCGYSEINRCNFMLRITDRQGNPILGISTSTKKESYESKPGAKTKIIPNFAEEFFKQRIKQYPEHLENYLLLADCYLRNDKAKEAELVMNRALEISPHNAALHHHLLEVYYRHEKDDETNTIMEKIYAFDKNIPAVLNYKIENSLKSENAEQTEIYLKQLEKLIPDSPTLYNYYIRYYGLKKESEMMMQMVHTAYHKFPENFEFVAMEMYYVMQQSKDIDQAIKILKKYSAKRYNPVVYYQLAALHLLKADIKTWQKSLEKCLEFEPTNSDVYEQLANLYKEAQDFIQAEHFIEKGLEICPTSASLWVELGEVYRLKGDKLMAKQAYRKALTYEPTLYSVRDKLREIDGLSSVFSNFTQKDINYLIDHAPEASKYPENGAVIMLDDAKRVVYENGGSEFVRETLVKVFNEEGLDHFKHFNISYTPFYQELIFENAHVIKPDGSKIDGEQLLGSIIFKALEKNDIIHVKWKTQNNFIGNLAHYFWDEFYFNGLFPREVVRYSLLTSKNGIQYSTQNMDNCLNLKKVRDGLLYEWELKDVPAIRYENGMPPFQDVGKILYISNLPDWEHLVKWYAEVTEFCLVPSYEVKNQAEKLFKGKEHLSRTEKIQIIYNFINENIRYSSISFKQSGLIPQKARNVLIDRIGDCKDMATLCIALLREVGIDAYYLLVNTKDEGLNNNPSFDFF